MGKREIPNDHAQNKLEGSTHCDHPNLPQIGNGGLSMIMLLYMQGIQ